MVREENAATCEGGNETHNGPFLHESIIVKGFLYTDYYHLFCHLSDSSLEANTHCMISWHTSPAVKGPNIYLSIRWRRLGCFFKQWAYLCTNSRWADGTAHLYLGRACSPGRFPLIKQLLFSSTSHQRKDDMRLWSEPAIWKQLGQGGGSKTRPLTSTALLSSLLLVSTTPQHAGGGWGFRGRAEVDACTSQVGFLLMMNRWGGGKLLDNDDDGSFMLLEQFSEVLKVNPDLR